MAKAEMMFTPQLTYGTLCMVQCMLNVLECF